ncbi:unnamed protein product [Spodoptera littoralis]|uniref:Exocyst complex component Sec6 n=1 Tax=Spodoptera littoralis TaxID=7109 RepID=A0A9P0I797_SPOLI|nr:unnamed protein product [Spodoptera littoralis]CAH1641258.1 unnamed protein product [Spodoptera littoralis]
MFVLFLSFALLRISVNLSTEKNAPLKAQLQRSLSHVNDMLADIEGKIDKERRLLLNNKRRDYMDYTKRRDYMDYTVTDIWWDDFYEPAPENSTEVSTTSKLFEKTLETTVPTHPPNWPFPEDFGTNITQQQSLLQYDDIKSSMTVDGLGYGSASIDKLFNLIFKKELQPANELFIAFVADLNERISAGKLASMSRPFLRAITDFLREVGSLNEGVHHIYATDMMELVQSVIKNKNTINGEYKELIDFYDSLFTKQEGEELLASLEVVERYPQEGKTPEKVCERMLGAFLAPYQRIEGTEEQKKLVRLINKVSQKFREFYAQYSGHNSTIRPDGA